MRKQVLGAIAASLLIFACSSESEPETAGNELLGTTGMKLTVDTLADTDVGRMRFELTPVLCGENGGGPIGETMVFERDLEDMLIPGPIEALKNNPLDGDSEHLFADQFVAVEPGCYDVRTVPLTAAGAPSGDCAPAQQKGLEVAAGQTLEVTLINQCSSEGDAAIDVIAAINHPPELGDVEFSKSKFVPACDVQEVCATAYDPDHDPLEFVWTPRSAASLSGPTVTRTTSERPGEVTQCVSFIPLRPGDYSVDLVIYDQARRDGNLVRIQDWLAQEGYPNDSHVALNFPFYAGKGNPKLDFRVLESTNYTNLMDLSDNAETLSVQVYDGTTWNYARWTQSAGFVLLAKPSASDQIYPQSISGDGQVLVGQHYNSATSTTRAVRWLADGTMQELSTPADEIQSWAQGASADGSVVFGYAYTSSANLPFVWTEATGRHTVELLPGQTSIGVNKISEDGSTLIGTAWNGSSNEPIRWTQASGTQSLGALPGGISSGQPIDVSNDGSAILVVGWGPSGSISWRWTAADGYVGIGDSATSSQLYTYAMDADGSTIVGYFRNADNQDVPFRWTAESGVVPLATKSGTIPNGYAHEISDDGQVVLGYQYNAVDSGPFVWDAEHGVRSVRSLLLENCVDIEGWNLWGIRLSADGTTLVGQGQTLNGISKTWSVKIR